MHAVLVFFVWSGRTHEGTADMMREQDGDPECQLFNS
jgi:hypothetical protein